MSTRRSFIKSGCIAGLAASVMPAVSSLAAPVKKGKLKNWIWINPDTRESADTIRAKYKKFVSAGVNAIFFEHDSPLHFRIAKECGMEAHRWMWTMNRGEKSLLNSHPEWYAVNRKGESCADKPPYVDYYRWLCPSRPEVKEYLLNDVRNILSNDYVDGIHLDYVRFCDVVLPVNLWQNYHIEQTRELPEYDYCYCEVCKSKFKEWRGQDIAEIEFPEASLSWRQFRYDAVTNIVNAISHLAASHKKAITAAVFPTPEVARRNVRQDWINWKLTGIAPMIYHGFYKEPVEWIGDAVKEGVRGIDGRFPLYAGIYIPDFKSSDEIEAGMTHAFANGAAGISLFGNVTDEILAILKKVTNSIK